MRENTGKSVEYAFFESIAGENRPEDRANYFATVEIDLAQTFAHGQRADEFSIEKFKSRATSAISAEDFYARLRENGNQYGPRFQGLSEIWRSEDQALGRLSARPNESGRQERAVHLLLLDSIVQLLAAFRIEAGKTFLLKSIGRIEFQRADLPETLWAHATRQLAKNEGEGLTGNIEVLDESGSLYIKLADVSIAYLPRTEGGATKTDQALQICVASTFTAEPLEDVLKFWSDHFGIRTHIHFAGHGQVFQQLLDNESDFRKNRDGVNAIVLALEDWTATGQQSELQVDRLKIERCLKGSATCVLPNGLTIAHLHKYETDYLYQEIFRDQCYLRNGIQLKDGAIVIDIGANIGLFSLFVMSQSRNSTIYAFEPSPIAYDVLKRNCEAYGSNAHTFQCGVSGRSGDAKFTFYDNSSVFSGFYANNSEDRKALETIVRGALKKEIGAPDKALDNYTDELITDRLRSQTYSCRIMSVSDIIRENKIEKVHLLKIDAEKSELDIIKGIDERDWPLIEQIVVEVHDRTKQALIQIERLLTEKGYSCAIEQEQTLENSGFFNIYATRLEKAGASAITAGSGQSLQRNISDFCAALNSFMACSKAPLLLCVCPCSREAGNDQALEAAEKDLLSRTSQIANVHSISSQSILHDYRLSDYHDPHTDRLAHIPYTAEGYAAFGTTLFRALKSLESGPLKVIVLDCDDTLWAGACGEDGPLGIQVTADHRLLQEFVVEQARGGLLVCLCSKNNEKDVFDVLDQRNDMILKREHIASWQINWDRKSTNIKALAEELNLGLESFLFIDDSPLECAEVRINCPEVLTLQLPQKTEMFGSFLNGIWGLSKVPVTAEDRTRTKMYRDDLQRKQFQAEAMSLQNFLDGLRLRIQVSEPTKDQLGRVSQLTFRTNQFNFTTIRRSEKEIRNWLESDGRKCLVASVSDRFGDYGLVGVLLYEATADQFIVDTFLLSCRALGRGVEHYLLSELARIAQQEGRKLIDLPYQPTEKNAPVLGFIKSLPVDPEMDEAGALRLRLPADELVNLRYEPEEPSQLTQTKQPNRVIREPQMQASRWFSLR